MKRGIYVVCGVLLVAACLVGIFAQAPSPGVPGRVPTVIQFQNAGSVIGNMAGFFKLNCTGGLTCSKSGSTITAAGGTATIASGATALGTSQINSGACASAVTAVATGTLTTDVIAVTFNADPTAVTGYTPATTGMLTIITYPTADTFNAKVCNTTGSAITPGAITLNWRVVR